VLRKFLMSHHEYLTAPHCKLIARALKKSSEGFLMKSKRNAHDILYQTDYFLLVLISVEIQQ